jgi:ABC-type transporter Mla subunit MlaD
MLVSTLVQAAIADQFVKERGDVLNDVVGVAAKRADELVDNAGKTVGMAAKRADELVDNAGKTVGMAAKRADELVDNAGKTVGMAAQRADELVDTAASTAKGLRDNTTHIMGDILQNSTKNVMEGIETLEWVPEWKEALEGLHRNLESTVHDQWDRLHGLEVVEEADDVDGYEYMEGESYEAMM